MDSELRRKRKRIVLTLKLRNRSENVCESRNSGEQ